MDEDTAVVPQISALRSVGSCVLLSVIYVASLYIRNSDLNRDHPNTIKSRFCSVFAVMVISPLFVYTASSKVFLSKFSLWEALGLRQEALIPALIIPLLLTMILFLGPISSQYFSGVWKLYIQPSYWTMSFQNLVWIRNHIVAPLSEEFTFRACMLPVLVQSFSPSKAIWITPLFFGIAHFHHMHEHLRQGMELRMAILLSVFQFGYTSVFGMYSAYLFLRTGHFVAPFIAHAFCNHMGFPDFQELLSRPADNTKKAIAALYVVGLIAWIGLISILTEPKWYSNAIYWHGLRLSS